MILEYLNAAAKKINYEKLENNTWYAEIPECTGVWSNCNTIEECRKEILEVLEEWILLKIKDNDDDIPIIDGIEIKFKQDIAA